MELTSDALVVVNSDGHVLGFKLNSADEAKEERKKFWRENGFAVSDNFLEQVGGCMKRR